MSRPKRIALGGYVYHVLNRANGRLRIFRKDDDFLGFEQIMAEGGIKVSACPIGGTFFDDLCLVMNSYIIRAGPRNLLIMIYYLLFRLPRRPIGLVAMI